MGGWPTQGGPGKVGSIDQIGQLSNLANSFLKKMNFLFKQGKPLVAESSAQQLEALRTGGVGAKIPLIQRSVEASKQATGTALAATKDDLAAAGIGATPFGQNILAQTRMRGEQAASQIPPAIAEDVIHGGTTGLDSIRSALGFGAAGSRALTSSAGLELGREEFNSEQFAKFMEDLKSSLQGIGMSAGGGGA
jgi:hypothetical protein